LTSKALRALKMNSLKFKNRKPNKINYLQFFKDFESNFATKNISHLMNRKVKSKKVTALILLKKFVDKIIYVNKNKIINHSNKLYPTEIYFKKWKDFTWQETKELQHKVQFKKSMMILFFSKAKGVIEKNKFLKYHNLRKFYLSRFLFKIRREKKLDERIQEFKNQMKMFNIRSVFGCFYNLINGEPTIRFVKINLLIFLEKNYEKISNFRFCRSSEKNANE
jgi:hypothetical protein